MKKKVLIWFKVYCGILAAVYLLVIPIGIMFLTVDSAALEMDPMEAKVQGIVCISFGLPMLIAVLVPFFLKPKPWVWFWWLSVWG